MWPGPQAQAAKVAPFAAGFKPMSEKGPQATFSKLTQVSWDGCRAAAGRESEIAFPYPQKLWITLWTSHLRQRRNPFHIAYLLPWLKNNQGITGLYFNELHLYYWATSPVLLVMYSFADATPATCA
jgi:hypothetical protein